MDSYKRLRHTYGFGVHSPFAFRMVKDVVRPGRGYGWYGYEDIDAAMNMHRGSLKIERQAKMFHRLLAFLSPESLFLPHGIDPIFYTAASTSDRRMKIERRPKYAAECQMIATNGSFISLNILKEHIIKPGNSIAFLNYPTGWIEQLFDILPEGLMLYGKRNAIIVNRPEMMKVRYSMIL